MLAEIEASREWQEASPAEREAQVRMMARNIIRDPVAFEYRVEIVLEKLWSRRTRRTVK